MSEIFVPKIMVLATEKCAYPGADAVGKAHQEYPANVSILRVLSPVFFPEDFYLKSYAAGIDGIGTANPGSRFDVIGNGTGLSMDPANGTTIFGALGFNREVATGAILSPNAYACQFTHFGSTTNTSDYLALQVNTPTGGAVTNNALVVNGVGNVGIALWM